MDKVQAYARLLRAVEYLKDNGVARNHEEIAQLSRINRSHVTAALNQDFSRITKGNLTKIADAYSDLISKDWLVDGIGDMAVPSKNKKPHIPVRPSAGGLDISIDSTTESECQRYSLDELFTPDYDNTISAVGDSMEPTISSHDILMCRRIYSIREVKNGEIYVIGTKSGAIIKRIKIKGEQIIAHSDNPEYKDFPIEDDITDILKVVGVLKTL